MIRKGRRCQECLKTLVFSSILCPSEGVFPLSQAEVRNLKNTVWKTPFGTLRFWRPRLLFHRIIPFAKLRSNPNSLELARPPSKSHVDFASCASRKKIVFIRHGESEWNASALDGLIEDWDISYMLCVLLC